MARPRAFDEQQVLDAVREQFWITGYSATSMEDLTRVTGLGRGSLYAAFGDKRQLFLRALHSYTDDSHGSLQRALTETPRALDALRTLLEAPTDDTTGPGVRRGCLMANSTYELGNADSEVLEHARRTYETSIVLISGCVARAQREGDLPTGTDSLAFARALLAVQQGLVFMSRTGLDAAALTAMAASLKAQLLPDHAAA